MELYSKEFCELVRDYVNTLPAGRWAHRLKINSLPTAGTEECDYWFLGDKQQPKEFSDFLFGMAPLVDGAKPVEAIINRYEVGGGMAEHIDIAVYRTNLVVMLSNNDDGIIVEDVFYKDDPGKAIIFPFKSPPHSVPPVKKQRFVLIYLYE